jgi:hypothetical protein
MSMYAARLHKGNSGALFTNKGVIVFEAFVASGGVGVGIDVIDELNYMNS